MVGIEMKDLSQTFADAVTATREMNVRYLWIDSLCIIQDSFDDWAAESSKMGEYYMNSLFNISAVSASDGSEGCFTARNPLQIAPCHVNILFPATTQDKSKALFLRSSGMGWDPVTQTAPFQRPPLWQRAWVVQERLLSARLLQYSRMQLSWKCSMMVASENIPEGVHDFDMTPGDRLLRQALVGLKKFSSGRDIPSAIAAWPNISHSTAEELTDLYNAWYDLVSLYGKCALTKESDIFPAISGIAKAIANATGDRYIAGLWKHDLHRGLLWSAPDSTSSKPGLRRYRAPSWSWASLKATCTFYVREISQASLIVDKGHFRINNIICLGTEVSPYGEVAGAKLDISGLLKRAHPRGDDSNEEVFRKITDSSDRHSLFDLEGQRTVGYYFADNIATRFLTEIWCCPVITEKDGIHHEGLPNFAEHSPRPIEARCLALVAINENERIFVRVGSAWVQDFTWFSNCKSSNFSIA
jgi:hypothetical protein